MEEGLATGKIFQLVNASSIEPRILVTDHELRQSYKIGKQTIVSLPELAIIHHRTWFCIGPKHHIPKVAVATAELQSLLLHSLQNCDYLKGQQQHANPRELQRQSLRSGLAWLLLMNVEVTVRVDDRGRPKPSGQLLKRYHFGDLLIKDDHFRIGLGKHVGAANYSLDIGYTQFQEFAQPSILFDPADVKSFPTMTNRFQDTGSSGTL